VIIHDGQLPKFHERKG